MAMWHDHRAPIKTIDLTAVVIQPNQFLLLRTFAQKPTCSQTDSGVRTRTQSQPQSPHELLSFSGHGRMAVETKMAAHGRKVSFSDK
jgi:hypothetical protein